MHFYFYRLHFKALSGWWGTKAPPWFGWEGFIILYLDGLRYKMFYIFVHLLCNVNSSFIVTDILMWNSNWKCLKIQTAKQVQKLLNKP